MQCKWKINALTIRLSNFSISLFRPYFSPSLLAAAALPAVPRAGVRKTALAQDSKSLCIWVCVCVVLKENTAVWLVKASSLITLARWKKVERQKEEFFIRTSSVTQGVTKGEIGCRRMCCKLFFFVQLFVSWLFFSHFSSSSGPKYNPSLCCLFLFCMSAVSLLFTSLLPAVLACPVTGTHNAARAFSGTALEEPQAFPQCRGQLWRASHCPPEPDENVHRSLPAVLADQAIR